MQTANQNIVQPAGQAAGAQGGTVNQVAWQFVVQYYTYVNSKPDQLHRFYNKSSHYLHGVEGEETSVLQGQAAIHKKFVDIGFKGCKVFIHSVDAHPSANNGILVHVIGEMSNNNEPWKKFVQAFFLAEQQNGYFVMNDNFRYLKEETFGEEDEEGAEGQDSGEYSGGQGQIPYDQPAPSIPEQTQPSYGSVQTNGYHDQSYAPPTLISHPAAPAHAPAPAPVEPPAQPIAPAAPAPAEPVVEETPAPIPEPAPVAVPEVVEPVKPPQPATPPAKLATPAPPSPAAVSRKTPSPVPPHAAPISEPPTGQPPSVAPTPAAPASAPSTAPTTQPQPPSAAPAAASPAPPSQPAQPPQPAAPPVPKTWAGMAAANSSRWGHNVAQEAKGVSASVPQQQQPHATPTAQPPRERPAGGPAGGAAAAAGGDPALQPGGVGPKNIPPNQQHPLYAQALTITTPLCFIKGVTENIPQQALEQVLSSRFGPIKDCEVVRNKACAFLEFKSVDSAKRAIIASLHPNNGGDGGVKLDEEKYGSPARVIVETRKERGDRPAPRPRGGTPIPAGEGRGAGDKGAGSGPGQQGQGNYRGGRGGGNVRGRGDGGRGGKA